MPMMDNLLHAALVALANKLDERVVLPSNLKKLSEAANVLDHQKFMLLNLRLPPPYMGTGFSSPMQIASQ